MSAETQVETTREKITDEEILQAISEWNREDLNLWSDPRIGDPNKLPVAGEKNILVTSALPYVNNVPHLGNIIGSTLSADFYARYARMTGANVLYVCGTDEYGTATENKALEEKTTPREICDKYHALHSQIYEWFNISFDKFGRTSCDQQTQIVQQMFLKLYDAGYFVEQVVEQLFCTQCERFLADRFVEGTCPFCSYEDARGDQCDKCGKLINAMELANPKCKTCCATPSARSSKHLFLDLAKMQPQLEQWLDDVLGHDNNWSTTAKVITQSWLRDGLKPRCITRDLKWGIPVPLEGFEDKVFYVWFDAPIGYISITASLTPHWQAWWKDPDNVEMYNFLGKDNVTFHSIIFPGCLLATNEKWTIVNHIPAVEYLNYEDSKFSKSRGVGVFGDSAKETGIPVDIWRFYLAYVRPESQDSAFNWNDLMSKSNTELLNNLGNFINRSLSFMATKFDAIVPEMVLTEVDKTLVVDVNRELAVYCHHMDKVQIKEGLKTILNITRLGNQFMQNEKPWIAVKKEETKERAGTVIGLAANISALVSILLSPFMPETCSVLQSQMNVKCNLLPPGRRLVAILRPGHEIGKPFPLFKKLEQKDIDNFRKRFSGGGAP